MRASTVDMVKTAEADGRAVGAFNVFNDLTLRAVVDGAASAGQPAIIQVSVRTARSVGVQLLAAMFEDVASRVDVPVALHLDHCPDVEVIEEVVEAGWSSVLFDASHLDLDEAREQTKRVVDLAHSRGVAVESEIENIVGVEDGVGGGELVHSYAEQTLADVAQEAGVDLLAPQLGTAHGLYAGRPLLRPDRVRTLKGISDLPIVLHGGTGLTDEEFRSFIRSGVSKINISTAVKHAFIEGSSTAFGEAREADEWEPLPLLERVASRVEAEVERLARVFAPTSTGEAQQ